MKICIIGCGAVGSIFAAHLGQLDEVEVYALDVWQGPLFTASRASKFHRGTLPQRFVRPALIIFPASNLDDPILHRTNQRGRSMPAKHGSGTRTQDRNT